jgi:hypothetical protein
MSRRGRRISARASSTACRERWDLTAAKTWSGPRSRRSRIRPMPRRFTDLAGHRTRVRAQR